MRCLWLNGLALVAFACPAAAEELKLLPVAATISDTQPLALAAPQDEKPATGIARADSLTIVIGGDLGFGGSGQPPSTAGAPRHNNRVPFDVFAGGLKPLLAGDVVFANLETVVSDRSDLKAVEKAFNFRSHPVAVRHIVELGINAVSTANNHAADYGDAGLSETLRHLANLRGDGSLRAFPGLGWGRAAALAPQRIDARGRSIHISAIGIGGGGLGVRDATSRPAMAFYGSQADLDEVTAGLAGAGGDVRMLSVHYGIEMSVRPTAVDEMRLRAAAIAADAQIVAGHHAHVAAGVQNADGRFLFYGLGNLLHPGMQDMSRHGICRDYGLLARIHLGRAGDGFTVRAIEVTTLADMHAGARPRTGEDGRTRVAVLNHLAAGLDRPGTATGVRFSPREDGTGLWCAEGAAADGGSIGALCRGHEALAPPPAELTRRIAASCGGELVARGRSAPSASRAPAVPVSLTASAPPSPRNWQDAVLHSGR